MSRLLRSTNRTGQFARGLFGRLVEASLFSVVVCEQDGESNPASTILGHNLSWPSCELGSLNWNAERMSIALGSTCCPVTDSQLIAIALCASLVRPASSCFFVHCGIEDFYLDFIRYTPGRNPEHNGTGLLRSTTTAGPRERMKFIAFDRYHRFQTHRHVQRPFPYRHADARDQSREKSCESARREEGLIWQQICRFRWGVQRQ